MSKNVLLAVSILMILISGLLFFQWNTVSISTFSSGKKPEQNVAVRHMQNHFQVKQSIKQMPEGSYEIRKPKKLDSFSCESSRHQSCVWLNQEKTRIAFGKEEEITFTYQLSSAENRDHFVLDNWLFQVEDVTCHFSRIQLTEEKWRQGEWLAAADSIGKKKMDAIDYYVFETNHESPALYWNANRLQEIYKDQHVAIYSENSVPADFSKLKDLDRSGKLLAVMTKKEKKFHDHDDLILVPNQGEEAILLAILKKTLLMEEKQEWLLDVMISAFFERPFGSEKAQKMYLELERELQKDGVNRWLAKVLPSKTVISARDLDEYIWETAGIKTNFFTINAQEKKPFIPYYVLDERPVLVNGKAADEITILYHGEHPYISFIPLVAQLGFAVQSGTNEVMIKRGDGAYHFYYGRKIFYKNGRPFGLSGNPFLTVGEETYIRTELLLPVLGVNINETSNQIHLKE